MRLTIALTVVVLLLLSPVVGLVIFNAVMARRVERIIPPVGRFVSVDGVKLHYLDEGTGPPVLMIHGLASQLQTYTYAVAGLLRGRYRLIMIDRPGSGYSQAAPSATLGAQVALISGVLRALEVDRALVVGHSLGGAVALALAIDHPEQVAGLALLAPATQPQGEAPDALKGLAVASDPIRWIFGWTIAAPLSMRYREVILAMLFGPDPVPTDFGTRGASLLSLRPASYRNASRDLVMAGGEMPSYAKRYGSITAPVGVLFGRGDRILDYAVHGEMLKRQIADVELETIEDGGHMTPISSPERSAAFIDKMARRAGLVQREAQPAP